jgi:SNF2 family DNA or RNA helicase
LSSIEWSRIVLDEGKLCFHCKRSPRVALLTPLIAHQIRNSSTKQFKAAASLESDSRWCLTGTPIQNTFDDLRSLLQFLRFEPFCQNKAFEEHIIKPFRAGLRNGSDASRNLRIMLKTCCIRRTQVKLNLPSTTTEKVSVMPTEDEKALFKQILEQCREEFDMLAGKDGGSKRPNVLFSTIMKLRRVCNHGSITVESTSTKQSNQLVVPKKQRGGSRSPSSEPACEYCTGKDKEDEFLGMMDSCPLCGRFLSGGNDDTTSMAPSPMSLASPATSMMDVDTPEPTTSIFDKFTASNELKQQSSKMSAVIDNIKTSCIDVNSKR